MGWSRRYRDIVTQPGLRAVFEPPIPTIATGRSGSCVSSVSRCSGIPSPAAAQCLFHAKATLADILEGYFRSPTRCPGMGTPLSLRKVIQFNCPVA